MGLENHAPGGAGQSKSGVEKYPNPDKIILRPTGVGLFPPCSEPACPRAQKPYDPHLHHPWGSLVAWWPGCRFKLPFSLLGQSPGILLLASETFPSTSTPADDVSFHWKNLYLLPKDYLALVPPLPPTSCFIEKCLQRRLFLPYWHWPRSFLTHLPQLSFAPSSPTLCTMCLDVQREKQTGSTANGLSKSLTISQFDHR